MIVEISFQNDQDQSFSDQNTQILNAKNNFHVDLDVNIIDSNKQRVINNAQIDILRNVNVVSNNVFCVKLNVVSNKMFRVISILSIQNSFIRIFVHKAKSVFSKHILHIILKYQTHAFWKRFVWSNLFYDLITFFKIFFATNETKS
jgi:hypothetical protein